jgi:hypothetical protein
VIRSHLNRIDGRVRGEERRGEEEMRRELKGTKEWRRIGEERIV